MKLDDNKVAISSCETYEVSELKEIIKEQFNRLNIASDEFKDKKVVLKPNLLAKRSPEKAVTTHPYIVEAVMSLLKDYGANIIIAESPPGSYTPPILKEVYKSSGFYESGLAIGALFNYDTSFQTLHNPNGIASKSFDVITPIMEADIIINLCKLKTHALTKMTCGVKNLFGTMPGTKKFEMHARFSKSKEFTEMLIDLCEGICNEKPVITICDGIVAMEGNGPSAGTPRKVSGVLTSRNPFALDLACCEIINFGNSVEIVETAKRRGLCPNSGKGLDILGTQISELVVEDFKAPDSQRFSRMLKCIPPFLKPRPVINKKACVGCEKCAKSCPVNIISMKDKKAYIKRKDCIRCFCCQELCPYKAVNIKGSFIYKILK